MPAGDAAFNVLGLHCPSCALRLEAVLAAAPGIAKARVHFLSASAVVWAHDPAAQPIDADALVTCADHAGFRLTLGS